MAQSDLSKKTDEIYKKDIEKRHCTVNMDIYNNIIRHINHIVEEFADTHIESPDNISSNIKSIVEDTLRNMKKTSFAEYIENETD